MALNRRLFIRTVGGGVVLAAGAAWAIPSLDAMPAIAIEGWSGPAPRETDPRRRAVAWAILAPNPHNMQSWLVDLRTPDVVTLHIDRDRLLPETDPFQRQIVVGAGAFLELLVMAAAAEGCRAEVELFPDGAFPAESVDGRPVARVRFVRRPGVAVDPLFSQAAQRRSTKSKFDGRPLAREHVLALAAAHRDPAVPLAFATDKTHVDALRNIASRATLLEMNTPRTLKESIDRARIGASEIARHRDGISLYGPMMWALRNGGAMTPQKATTPGTMAFQGGLDYAMAGYASAAAFGWLSTPGNDRAQQVAAGRAYVRLNLKASELGVAMQPHSQALQEFPEMAGLFAAMRAATGVDDGSTLQMFFRLGYAAKPPGPSPRRPVEAFLTT
jgi:hypothetical protein